MAHVRDEDLIDFVRGTLPPERAASVSAHVERGCASCQRGLALWQAAIAGAVRDRMYTPPADAVRVARAQFAALEAHEAPTPLRALLVFDSFRHAPAAGVRGAAAAPRQLLYRAGPLAIDIRLEWTGGSTPAILIGQVAYQQTRAGAAAQYRVTLLDGERGIGAASTDRFGEFELRFTPRGNLALLVAAPDRPAVRLELADVIGGD